MNILRNVMWLCWFVYRCTNITHAEKKSRASNFSHICVESEMERGFTTALHTSIDGHGEKKSPPNKQFIQHTPFISCRTTAKKSSILFFFHREKPKLYFHGFALTKLEIGQGMDFIKNYSYYF